MGVTTPGESSNTGNATTEGVQQSCTITRDVLSIPNHNQTTTKRTNRGKACCKACIYESGLHSDGMRYKCSSYWGKKETDLAEQLNNGKKAFIFAVNGKTCKPGIEGLRHYEIQIISP